MHAPLFKEIAKRFSNLTIPFCIITSNDSEFQVPQILINNRDINLYSSNQKWWWTHFHVLVGHLYNSYKRSACSNFMLTSCFLFSYWIIILIYSGYKPFSIYILFFNIFLNWDFFVYYKINLNMYNLVYHKIVQPSQTNSRIFSSPYSKWNF